ncbi:hypothetical protein DB35_00195 [Streptomyces abyssalis]|uniref:Uncharacterized protein n=1 Tax=Streptomyces abyssalis TaxID=933944 RepID=A0A1E7JVY9_9ACTN|nr:hypothetical protein [Streptomyces abyssalis]OEU94863.1 hypothetical protein AN215_00175 [Streptomyces abyssalis]OEU95933.1 hypothetical protein DB35_00195 [Streptomyces abyssalis]
MPRHASLRSRTCREHGEHGAAPAGRIRVLLTARSTHGWWKQLTSRHPDLVSATAVTLDPRAVYRHYTPAQVQELAELSFSKHILALHRADIHDDWDAYEAADHRAARARQTRQQRQRRRCAGRSG